MMASNFKTKAMKLMTDQIYGEDYQKEKFNAKHAEELAKVWDDAMCDPLKVGYENGKYYVFCGQHRRAAKIIHYGGHCEINCIVFYGTTYADRARMFAEEDDMKYNTTPRQKYNALYLAGDKEMSDICNCIKRSGYNCAFSKQGGDVDCTVLARKIYRKHGADFLTELFTILFDAFGKNRKATTSNMVKGVAFFLEMYGINHTPADKRTVYRKDLLLKGLKGVSPEIILDRAKATIDRSLRVEKITWDYAVCLELVNTYNRVCTGRGAVNRLDSRVMFGETA